MLGKHLLANSIFVAFIHLGEHTGFKLINQYPDRTEDITVNAGKELKWFWPMNEESPHQQNNLLMLVLQRTPIPAAEIEVAMVKQFPDAKINLDVLQARDFLLPQFPGSYAFSYKSILRDPPCIEP